MENRRKISSISTCSHQRRYPHDEAMEALRDHVYSDDVTYPPSRIYAHHSEFELTPYDEKPMNAKYIPELIIAPRSWRKFKTRVFNLLERPQNTPGIAYHTCVFTLILASLFLSIIITIDEYANDVNIRDASYYLECSLAIVFTIEYCARIWSCSVHGHYTGFWGRMRFIRKPYMVIDVIVIVATLIVVSTNQGGPDTFNVTIFRFLRFVQVLRILRLDRQRGAFKIVSHVVYEHRQELLTCWYMSFILLVACAFLVYLAEKSDPDEESSSKIKNLGEGMYFGLITLLTVGYGDFYPNNWVAKIITCIFAFIGTAFFALPAGILGSGFALQVAQNQKQKHVNSRRIPAALIIQYAWRCHATDSVHNETLVWQSYSPHHKEKKYTTHPRDSPTATPALGGRKSMVFLRKKRNTPSENVTNPDHRLSSIGATIPSAIGLRDRCHSEGNLLLTCPQSVDDHQATIVSLPPSMMTDYNDTYGRGNNHHHPRHVKRPLDHRQKYAVKFIVKTKLCIAIRKLKEVIRPYDIQDVIEQYTGGQLEMFDFIKKFQVRMESAIGVKDEHSNQPVPSLDMRMTVIEQKVDSLNGKIDSLIDMMRKSHGDESSNQNSDGNNSSSPDSIYLPQQQNEEAKQQLSVPEVDERNPSEPSASELRSRLESLQREDESGKARSDSRFTITPTVLRENQPSSDSLLSVDIDFGDFHSSHHSEETLAGSKENSSLPSLLDHKSNGGGLLKVASLNNLKAKKLGQDSTCSSNRSLETMFINNARQNEAAESEAHVDA